jgi:small nuclear ribonucleoprotein D1
MRSWLLPESLNLDALLVEEKVVKKTVSAAGPAGRGRGRGRGRGMGRGRR